MAFQNSLSNTFIFFILIVICFFHPQLEAKGNKQERKDLSTAIENHNLPLVQTLLNSGKIKIDDRSEKDESALMEAAKCKDIETLKYLIRLGANINKKNQSGYTVLKSLSQALTKENDVKIAEILQVLIESGVKITKKSGSYILFNNACRKEARTVLETLLDAGHDINAKDSWESTGLNIAIHYASKDTAYFLLAKGASVQSTKNSPIIEALMNYETWGERDCLELIDTLKEAGADIYAKDDSKKSVIMHAMQTGNTRIIEYFLPYIENFKKEDSFGNFLLHYVARTNNIEIAKFLLEQGINIDHRNQWGESAFITAVEYNATTMAMFLYEQGAKSSTAWFYKGNAVTVAADNNNTTLLKFLIEKDMNVDQACYLGLSPLMHAVLNEHSENIIILLNAGATLNAKTKYEVLFRGRAGIKGIFLYPGFTSLNLARQIDNLEIEELLLSYGAK